MLSASHFSPFSVIVSFSISGAPPQITSPSTSARSSLQRNMPRVTGRQATSSAQGPVQLNEETSTVTTYYQSGTMSSSNFLLFVFIDVFLWFFYS